MTPRRDVRNFVTLALGFGPLAALVYVALGLSGLGSDQAVTLEGVLAFWAIAVLAEGVAVDFGSGVGAQQPKSSLAFLPFLGNIVLFPPAISVALVASVVLVSQLMLRRHSVPRAVYNVAQATISAAVSAGVYHSLGDPSVTLRFLPFICAAAVFFILNMVLASFAIAFLRNDRFVNTLAMITGPNGSNLTYDLLASPIAVILILLHQTSPVLGIFVIVLPLLLINYSYKSRRQLIEANTDLLRALVKAIETRDPYTSGHSIRVAALATAIAHDLGLPGSRVINVETSALLHDVGKIDPVYQEVLRKPHALDAEERTLIETHPQAGADILSSLRSVHEEVVLSVLHHHERFDGTGYPSQLSGQGIPLPARIIMVCDAVDAMLSDRPYRKALTIDVVRRELERFSGTQFDPRIVEVVLRKNTIERCFDLGKMQHETGSGVARVARPALAT